MLPRHGAWPACRVQLGQGVLVEAILWGGVSPTELWEQAAPGHGCGFAVSLSGLNPVTFKLFGGGAAEHPVSSAMPVLLGGDDVVRPSKVSVGSAGCALQSLSPLWGQP